MLFFECLESSRARELQSKGSGVLWVSSIDVGICGISGLSFLDISYSFAFSPFLYPRCVALMLPWFFGGEITGFSRW